MVAFHCLSMYKNKALACLYGSCVCVLGGSGLMTFTVSDQPSCSVEGSPPSVMSVALFLG